MKNFSNTYIFIFSAIMVVAVAALLSFVAMQLKPVQERNVRIETIQNILNSVHIENTTKNAEELFDTYIADSYVLSSNGEKVSSAVALEVDLKKEVAKIDEIKKYESQVKEQRISPFKAFMGSLFNSKVIDRNAIQQKIDDISNERLLPVYEVKKDTNTYYVLPLRGKGLWGPIWGFVALEGDMNTIYGAVFDHKSETPGLGAEITEDWFEKDFSGKQILQNGVFKSVEVVKGGTPNDNPYGVDAISGGTITSKGVEAMMYDCLNSYQTFFETKRN